MPSEDADDDAEAGTMDGDTVDGDDDVGDGVAADDGDEGGATAPSDDEVVEAAAAAADDLVFARIDRGAVSDYDVTVSFQDGILEVDVYVEAPDAAADADRVADDAALAARSVVDDLFGE